jgi:hypothetical protein
LSIDAPLWEIVAAKRRTVARLACELGITPAHAHRKGNGLERPTVCGRSTTTMPFRPPPRLPR